MTFECIRLISFSWLIGLTPEGGQTQYPLVWKQQITKLLAVLGIIPLWAFWLLISGVVSHKLCTKVMEGDKSFCTSERRTMVDVDLNELKMNALRELSCVISLHKICQL